ncbi:hypothetical protein BC5_0011 [Bacillus phage BC-5]|uniref:Uncharacterized protein n=1 Tax=Bacillus phage BC-5 TaxID=3020389 RepID=A0AAE9YK75_9CAUD|nr:hypothetical protein BC5_0011 [Bacillus phage BC-5]
MEKTKEEKIKELREKEKYGDNGMIRFIALCKRIELEKEVER